MGKKKTNKGVFLRVVIAMLVIASVCLFAYPRFFPHQSTQKPINDSSNNEARIYVNKDLGVSFENYPDIKIVEREGNSITYGSTYKLSDGTETYTAAFTITNKDFINPSSYNDCQFNSNHALLFTPCINRDANFNTKLGDKNAIQFRYVKEPQNGITVIQTTEEPYLQLTSTSLPEGVNKLKSLFKFTD